MTNLVFEPSQTTHWKNLFPSKMLLLGSQNLNEGEELVAKIQKVEVQKIKSSTGNEDQVPVIQFENAPPMVLNITNSRTIASLYGERYDEWIGKSIQIYATMVKGFGGGQVMGLRVREAIPDTGQDIEAHETALKSCSTMEELQAAFMAIPKHLKPRLISVKDEMKENLSADS
jgi:hypothetical protein